MDSYDSVRLYKAASDWCTKCGMHTKKHGCCHDEVKIIKLQDDYQTSSFSFLAESIQPTVTTVSEFLLTVLSEKDLRINKVDHSPPLLHQQEVYLQNRVFRI